MSYQEKLIQGKFNFYQDKQLYCEEFFKLLKDTSPFGNYIYICEILSRVKTGEFLKIYIDYELTHQFEVLSVRVKRSLGPNKSTERFIVDHKDKKVNYSFESRKEKQETQKLINHKIHIACPSFATSLAITHHKKVDPVHRTPYAVISSPNIWEFQTDIQESYMYVELVNSEPKDIKVQDKELKAIHMKLFEKDKISNPHAFGDDFFLSKYFQIPYLAIFENGLRVEIEELKNYQVDHSAIFKG